MAQILDLIGSSIIAGILLVTALSLNASVMESTILHNQNLHVQEEANFVTEFIDHDLNKVGYGDTLKSNIKAATAKSFVFRADINQDNRVDTVGYFFTTGSRVGSILTAWGCLPRTLPVGSEDSILFRFSTANEGSGSGIPMLISTKARRFSFSYLNDKTVSLGSNPSAMDSIRYIVVACELNNSYEPGDSTKALVHWTKVYRPKNIKK